MFLLGHIFFKLRSLMTFEFQVLPLPHRASSLERYVRFIQVLGRNHRRSHSTFQHGQVRQERNGNFQFFPLSKRVHHCVVSLCATEAPISMAYCILGSISYTLCAAFPSHPRKPRWSMKFIGVLMLQMSNSSGSATSLSRY